MMPSHFANDRHASVEKKVDWIVFGDDWGVHPSTTQHLILHLPPEDSVIWVDSIGMRRPRLRLEDLKRIWSKALSFVQDLEGGGRLYEGSLGTFDRLKPKVVPWHLNAFANRINRIYLRRAIGDKANKLAMRDPIILAADPVVVLYLDEIRHARTVYLRLDDYASYPGVDPDLVHRTERWMFERADRVVATAKALMPEERFLGKSSYLPQGVQFEHFARVDLEPPRTRVLGFFGTVAEWIDFTLIERVALAAPNWTLQFVGKIEYLPTRIENISNVRFLPAVPFSTLPEAMATWTAAWIPFQRNKLTEGVNPLKVREYLAAGLPTHSTPLPEVYVLAEHVKITGKPDEVVSWMERVLEHDDVGARRARRASVRADSWQNRSAELRRIVAGD